MYCQTDFSCPDGHECGEAVSPSSDADFISYQGVLSMLLNVNLKSSCGPDRIRNAFLQRYAELVAQISTATFSIFSFALAYCRMTGLRLLLCGFLLKTWNLFAVQLSAHLVSSSAWIHRLGQSGGRRPVIVLFQDYKKKTLLWNEQKLKGTTIYRRNDFSQCKLTKRRLFRKSAKVGKTAAKNVSLINDKLRVNDAWYIWDQYRNMRVKLCGTRQRRGGKLDPHMSMLCY